MWYVADITGENIKGHSLLKKDGTSQTWHGWDVFETDLYYPLVADKSQYVLTPSYSEATAILAPS